MSSSTKPKIFTKSNLHELSETIEQIVTETPIIDIHTHLFSPHFGELLLYGVDELLTYHYLIAETFRYTSLPYDKFWEMGKKQQAEFIWQTLFIDASPVSEAARGVLTALSALGIDISTKNLDGIRNYFVDISISKHVDQVFRLANLRAVVMTNDPFEEKERLIWDKDYHADERFLAALRIDPLLLHWKVTCGHLKSWGYQTDTLLSKKTTKEVRRFLEEWLSKTNALYMAVSLPPTFTYPDDSPMTTLLDQCILPIAREKNVPFAMMIGVERGVNPHLRLAGDGVGYANLRSLERLCEKYSSNKFMVTTLSRENQHELCVIARKFRNLMIFGCWWFLNNPSLIKEITRMRIELLGFSFIPQHSDARVLEQVIYKWSHTKQIISKVLYGKYLDVIKTGWGITETEIRRDVENLLGRNFWKFLQQ